MASKNSAITTGKLAAEVVASVKTDRQLLESLVGMLASQNERLAKLEGTPVSEKKDKPALPAKATQASFRDMLRAHQKPLTYIRNELGTAIGQRPRQENDSPADWTVGGLIHPVQLTYVLKDGKEARSTIIGTGRGRNSTQESPQGPQGVREVETSIQAAGGRVTGVVAA